MTKQIPTSHPVQPLRTEDDIRRAIDPATCGTCGLTWDDGVSTDITPVPSGRCPFEYYHGYADSTFERDTYNGWTNRETWALNLHMSNNQGDQEYWDEQAYDACHYADDVEEATDTLASSIETWLDDLYSAIESAATTDGESVTREAWSLLCDVGHNTSASVINYDEIAKAWIEGIAYDWDED